MTGFITDLNGSSHINIPVDRMVPTEDRTGLLVYQDRELDVRMSNRGIKCENS